MVLFVIGFIVGAAFIYILLLSKVLESDKKLEITTREFNRLCDGIKATRGVR